MVPDRAVNGTYSGSLTQVLSRLLDGYNYFIRHTGTEIEMTVVGRRGDHAAAVARPRPTPTSALSLSEAVRRKIR